MNTEIKVNGEGPWGASTMPPPQAPTGQPLNESPWLGLLPLIIVVVFWFSFSWFCITFYRDDNVTATGPLIIESARQVRCGHIPLHTYYVGGGGGTPLVSILQPGVWDPLKLVPALLLSRHPETMMNVIVCLHLGVFSLGGWYLALGLGAPIWAALVGAFALGFNGSLAVGAGNWEMNYIPFTFLPWIMGGLVRLAKAGASTRLLGAHLVLCWSGLSVFFSGSPTAVFYGIPAVLCTLVYTAEDQGKLRLIALRLWPQAVLLALVAGPLIWKAAEVYRYYGRETHPSGWMQLSVPLRAYLGLFIPGTVSVWKHVGAEASFTNLLVSCGIVPAWYIATTLIVKPRLLLRGKILFTTAAVLLFIPVLSPHAFDLSSFFSETPVLNMFKWPFRALPAFHVLVVFLFLIVAVSVDAPRSSLARVLLVAICCAGSVYSVVDEFRLAAPGREQLSWFVTNRYYEDAESWEPHVLEKLRSAGYVMTLSRREVRGVWFEKPRLYFSGNLGAEFKVRTVHRYLFGAQSRPYQELGMHFSGQTENWAAVKSFLASSLGKPPETRERWKNGIGPESLSELAEKTYVGGMVIEPSLIEPTNYFLNSRDWELIGSKKSAAVFIRRTP